MMKGFENFDYGNDITHLSEPDYDEIYPDSSWSCRDWKLYYEALRDEYGSTEAREIWNSKWAESPLHINADNFSCKYDASWRSWADSKGLIYDHTVVGQFDSWLYDSVQGVGGAVSGGLDAVGFITKNLKWIVLGGLVFVGAYAYKNFIKGNQQIKFK